MEHIMPNVLLAEDERITAMDLKVGLKKLGYNVVSVVDKGLDLIKEAFETSPDAIISDINLKDEITGIEAVKKILKKINIPVIIISGFNDEVTLTAVKNLGPCAFLRKPTNAREINNVLSRCLNA